MVEFIQSLSNILGVRYDVALSLVIFVPIVLACAIPMLLDNNHNDSNF